jgi:hypothetical protein
LREASRRAHGRKSRRGRAPGNPLSGAIASLAVCGKLRRPATPQVYEDAVTLKTAVSRACSVFLLIQLAAAAAGCSEFGFGRDKVVDPNVFPENYKKDILAYVEAHPAELVDARDAAISAPALRQFGTENRYFLCLRADAPDWHKEKVVIFFAGRMNQFVNAESNQCNAVQYQPFPELLAQLRELKQKK